MILLAGFAAGCGGRTAATWPTTGGNTAGTNGGNTAGTNGGNTAGANGGNTAGANGGNTAGTNGGNTAGTNGGNTAGTNGGTTGGTNSGSNGGNTAGTNGGQANAKRILFFLGDGMGITTLTAARIYAVGESGDLTMDTLPESGFVFTYSNDALVPDSAAAMSAYMTGVKVNNEVVGMSADTVAPPMVNGEAPACASTNGAPVANLVEQAKAHGWGAGVVTTARVTDSTPAAAYGHICHYARENDLAAQLAPGGDGYNKQLGDGVDVLFGGGSRQFLPTPFKDGMRTDGRNLLTEMGTNGYATGSTRAFFDALDPATTHKAIGLFTASDMSYDGERDPKVEPSLAEMTTKAMSLLEQRGSYFLVIEGGNIDHAQHASNAARVLSETVAFDNAVKAAIDRANQSDPGLQNTLIVVTADHDHTMTLNGYAKRTGPTTPTNPGILGLVKNVVTGALELDADNVPYSILGFGNGDHRVAGARSSAPALTDAVTSAIDYHQESVFQMGPGNETNGGTDVAIMAIGMNADRVHGFMDNVAVFSILRGVAGF
jgi:alkaline phosphatase